MPSVLRVARLGLTGLALVLVFAGSALAQNGRLAGTVRDASGGVLPGVSVTALHQPTSFTDTTTTNEMGAFVFPALRPGPYTVTAELVGFKTATFSGIIVNVGEETSLTARLEIGEVAEVITVEGISPLVKTTSPQVTSTVQQKQVLEIPLANRDITNLIKL